MWIPLQTVSTCMHRHVRTTSILWWFFLCCLSFRSILGFGISYLCWWNTCVCLPYLWSVTGWSVERRWGLHRCLPQVSEHWSNPPLDHSEVCGHKDPEHCGTLGRVETMTVERCHSGRGKTRQRNKLIEVQICRNPPHAACGPDLAPEGWSKPWMLPSSFSASHTLNGQSISKVPAGSEPRTSLHFNLPSLLLSERRAQKTLQVSYPVKASECFTSC